MVTKLTMKLGGVCTRGNTNLISVLSCIGNIINQEDFGRVCEI